MFAGVLFSRHCPSVLTCRLLALRRYNVYQCQLGQYYGVFTVSSERANS